MDWFSVFDMIWFQGKEGEKMMEKENPTNRQ